MTLNRQDARRDKNEPEIVAALELAGCRVKRGNWVDLVVQRALIAQGWKIHMARSVDDALKAVGLLRGAKDTA